MDQEIQKETQKLKKLLKKRVLKGITSLTPHETKVISMRCGLGNSDKWMTYKDIAKELKDSPQAVHWCMRKVTHKLLFRPTSKTDQEFVARNKVLAKTKDENPSMSFTELGKIFGIDRGTAHKIYLREKRKKREGNILPVDDL